MKKFLLMLAVGAFAFSAQAQTTAYLGGKDYQKSNYPVNANATYSGSETVYTPSVISAATDDADEVYISKFIYSINGGSAPSEGAGELTLYAATSATDLTSPMAASAMTKVFEGAVEAPTSFTSNGELVLELTEPVLVKKGEYLVVGVTMHATSTNVWTWVASDTKNSGHIWYQDNASDPVDFTGSMIHYADATYPDIPYLGIVYTTSAPVTNKATVAINEVYSTRTSADEASLEVLYEVTEAENLSALHFVVVDTEGNKLGEEDTKYGGRESSVYIDLSNLGSEDEVEVTVNCYPVWTDGTEGTEAVAEKTATVEAFVDNKFELTILEAKAERVSEIDATLDLRYTLEESNVDYYQFFVLDGNGNTVGKSDNINPAGRDASQEIQLTGLTADAQDLTIRWFVQYQDFMSDFVTYDQKVPLAAYNGEADGVELVGAENGEAVYFNLQGARVANPENGLYIRVENGKAKKVVVK